MIEVRCLENDSVRLETDETVSLIVIDYEPANLTVHPTPPPELPRVGLFFRIGVLCSPKNVLKGKPVLFGVIFRLKAQKPNFDQLNII